MSRWENEDVSDLGIPDPAHVETKFIGLQGKNTTEDQAIAKSVISSDGSRRFYVKYGRNEIVTISKGKETLEVKYKKSIPYLEKGWKINE